MDGDGLPGGVCPGSRKKGEQGICEGWAHVCLCQIAASGVHRSSLRGTARLGLPVHCSRYAVRF